MNLYFYVNSAIPQVGPSPLNFFKKIKKISVLKMYFFYKIFQKFYSPLSRRHLNFSNSDSAWLAIFYAEYVFKNSNVFRELERARFEQNYQNLISLVLKAL